MSRRFLATNSLTVLPPRSLRLPPLTPLRFVESPSTSTRSSDIRNHFYSSTTTSSSFDHDSERPSSNNYFTSSTIYPFILLSFITSLAINLSSSKTRKRLEIDRLKAQILVLKDLISRLKECGNGREGLEDDELERELRIVGLRLRSGSGSGSGSSSGTNFEDVEEEENGEEETSWKEVIFGKKESRYKAKIDDTDWEKLFKDADEDEKRRIEGRSSERSAVEVQSGLPERSEEERPKPKVESIPESSTIPRTSSNETNKPTTTSGYL